MVYTESMHERLTVVYDDDCPTCTVGKDLSASLDHKHTINFVGMNTEEGTSLVQKHQLDMSKSAYALHADGSKSSKSRMVRDVLARNGLIGAMLSLPFRIPYLGDMLYDVLALHRRRTTKSHID